MSILSALGIDSTLWIQFVIFMVAYIALTRLVFMPYFSAYKIRQEKTVGNNEAAERILEDTKSLQIQYEMKAKEISSEFRVLYDQTRTAAMREHDQLVERARAEAAKKLEAAREVLTAETEKARQLLRGEVPVLQAAIVNKMLGKELTP